MAGRTRSRTARTLASALGTAFLLAASLGVATGAAASPPVTAATAPTTAANDAPDRGLMIVGGQPADRKQTPWFVYFQPSFTYPDSTTQSYNCGAVAIDKHWFMTAAHCASDGEGKIGLGASHAWVNPEKNPSLYPAQAGKSLTITRVLVYPDWKPAVMNHDVAIVRVQETLPSSMPINTSSSVPRLGQDLKVWGFGQTAYGGSSSPVLRVAEIQDMAGRGVYCGDYRPGTYRSPTMICAGLPGGGVDSCQGDSGGPLTQLINNRIVLVGTVSQGEGCAEPRYPGIYARTSHFSSWVLEQISPASMRVVTPCQRCALRQGARMSITIVNSGRATGKYAISAAPGLWVSKKAGIVTGNSKRTITFKARSGKRELIRVRVSMSNRTPRFITFVLNPSRKTATPAATGTAPAVIAPAA